MMHFMSLYEHKLCRKLLNGLMPALIGVTLLAIFVSSLIFIWQFVQSIICYGWQQALGCEYPAGQVLCVLVPLLVAAITLKKTADIQTIDSLARLRVMLNSDNKVMIHKRLIEESGGGEKLSVDELDYIGLIELGAIMHRKGLISDHELYQQFGYRVENITKSSLFPKIKEDVGYYNDFFYIVKVVSTIKSKFPRKKEADI